MHCKRCDYPLWDTASRVCPECGLGFTPLDYEFVVNSVRFACPHCRQSYYGTGEKGHLVPRRFACVKCASEIDEAEMLVLEREGVTEEQTVGGTVAWRERRDRGRVRSFFRTVGQAAFLPNRLGRFYGHTTNAMEACWFGLISMVLAAVCSVGWCGGFVTFMQSSRLGAQGNMSDLASLAWDGASVTVVPVVCLAVWTFLWACVAVLVLRVRNPRRDDVTFARVMECFGYAWGACFPAAMPIMGVILSPLAVVWVAVSAIIQLQARFEVAGWRAVLSVLALPLVLPIVGLVWVLVQVWWRA